MNKRLLTTIVTHLVRGGCFVALLFGAINMIWFAQAQPQSSKRSQTKSETSRKGLATTNGAKTVVRVHDTEERPQIASPQQTYSITSYSGSIGYYLWRGVPCRTRPNCP